MRSGSHFSRTGTTRSESPAAAATGAGIPPGSAEDSLDQLPLLEGKRGSARIEIVHNTHADGYALRQGNWVWVDAPSATISKVPEWFIEAEGLVVDRPGGLYDLATDPGQRRDLQDAHPDRAARGRRDPAADPGRRDAPRGGRRVRAALPRRRRVRKVQHIAHRLVVFLMN